ncbi:MAG: hypothetical protein IJA41_04870 [Clostridia bacterium]|nr:hypothetical protein [Clostridia bacterium]
MISVLILEGFEDSSLCADSRLMSEVLEVYIPFLVGALRYNGIKCSTVRPSGFEREYSIIGNDKENIVYVPSFSCAKEKSAELFNIYTDSTDSGSVSFRLASRLRKERENSTGRIVFVNALYDYHPLKKISPVIMENIRFPSSAGVCDMVENIYKTAVIFAKTVCDTYGVIFKEPK